MASGGEVLAATRLPRDGEEGEGNQLYYLTLYTVTVRTCVHDGEGGEGNQLYLTLHSQRQDVCARILLVNNNNNNNNVHFCVPLLYTR